MSEVFYRKWRPRRLDQVVGQEAITQTLRNAVALGRVAHAYLFCGPRGTGKTSTARILAKAVNCLSPQDGEPDNRCEICTSINESRALDLIEIDAASNRGIDDIRDLREKVHFSPNQARYKVYIIDEVHMLTEQAFNALLKTLEEPPEHAIFVLATTEAHKVPLTIISRCQRFDFRRIPLEAAVERLAELCRDEGIDAAQEALNLIARTSAGSLRDAENLLEQALISYGSPLSEDQVRDLLELGAEQRALELAGHVVTRSVREGLTVINEVAGEGVDLRQFHRGVLECLRGVLLIKSGTEASLGYPEEARAQMRTLAEQTSLAHLVRALKNFARVDVRRDTSSPLPLELALVESSLEEEAGATPSERPSSPATAVPVESPSVAPPPSDARHRTPSNATPPPGPGVAEGRTTPGGQATSTGGPDPARSPYIVPGSSPPGPSMDDSAPRPSPSGPHTPQPPPEDLPSEPQRLLDSKWDSIIKELRTRKGKRFNLSALLRVSAEREVADGTITLKYSHPSHQQRMQEEMDDPSAGKVLRETFAQAMGHPFEIRTTAVDGLENGPRQSASQKSHLVRAAQAMGARVVGEKEEEHDE
jgi:DNA polymerase-3 subunit gamma/tau